MTPARRQRADVLLHERGLAPSREKARALILAGQVIADGQRVEKAGQMLGPGAELSVAEPACPYVSRGGLKLRHALDCFGVDPTGRRCLDVGASTGGFTDCLLQAGAAHVVAVDVGRGQLDWTLTRDPRVTELSGVNARHLEPAQVGEPPTLVTADVAFISLTKVLPAVLAAAPAAELVLLVKPQFEAGRRQVGRGGVVRDPAVWLAVLREVSAFLAGAGWQVVGATASPITGPAGNHEFLLHARPRPAAAPCGDDLLRAAVDLAVDSAGRGRKDDA